jgi:hypothetical protein
MASPEAPEFQDIEIQVPITWVDDHSPVVVVNQFVIHFMNDLVHLTVGHTPFPLVAGDANVQAQKIRDGGPVPTYVRGRFVLEKGSVAQLRDALSDIIKKADLIP